MTQPQASLGHRRTRTLVALAALMLIAACAWSTPPGPPAPPPPPDVPAGCMADLSGQWVHAVDSTYRYDATDDGGTLRLVVTRVPALDAGFRRRLFRADGGAPDAGPPAYDAGLEAEPEATVVVLERTAHGFVGESRAVLNHPSQRRCDVRFHTEVLACSDGGLLLAAQTATALGEACQAPANALPVPRVEQQLLRAP
jgi:hypothetical protein